MLHHTEWYELKYTSIAKIRRQRERTRESCNEEEKMSEEMTVTTELPHGNNGGNIVKQEVCPNCETKPTHCLLFWSRGSHWNSRPPQGEKEKYVPNGEYYVLLIKEVLLLLCLPICSWQGGMLITKIIMNLWFGWSRKVSPDTLQ